MSTYLERIRAYAIHKNISLSNVSIAAGKSGAYLSNSIKQGSIPSVEFVSKIIDLYPDLNPNWLLTGKGRMVLNQEEIEKLRANAELTLTIDELIDKKIDDRLKAVTEGIRELIIHQIEHEVETTKKELPKSKKGRDVK